MSESADKQEVVHVRLPSQLAMRLRREAKAQRRSVTQVAQFLLADALDRQEAAAEAEAPRETKYVPLEEP